MDGVIYFSHNKLGIRTPMATPAFPYPIPVFSEKVESYKERATFVHLYGPEPHPSMPGTNFDKGITWQNYWSVFPQHQNYAERVAMAKRISDLIHPDEVISLLVAVIRSVMEKREGIACFIVSEDVTSEKRNLLKTVATFFTVPLVLCRYAQTNTPTRARAFS